MLFPKLINEFQFKIQLLKTITLFSPFELNNHELKLLSNYSEIEKIIKTNQLGNLKILYFNMNAHKILFDSKNIISFDKFNISFESLADLFYINLLIMDNTDIVNYDYSIEIIRNIDKEIKKIKNSQYKIVIFSKININLIDNYIKTDRYNEEENEELCLIKNDCIENIRNKMNIFQKLNINYNEKDIIRNKVDALYIKILIELIKSNKFESYEYIYNIIKELDLEYIDITKNIFDEIYKILNPQEEYIKIYLISEIKDLININKINFYYILLKYIFKNSFYIYQIPIFLKLKKTIIYIIKNQLNNLYNLINIEENNIKEKVDYIIEIISDSKYYFQKYISYFKLNYLKEILYYYKEYYDESKKEDINKIEKIIQNNEIDKFDEYLFNYEKAKKYNIKAPIIKYLFNNNEKNDNGDDEINGSEYELSKYIKDWEILENMIKEKKYKEIKDNIKIKVIKYFNDINNKNILLKIFTEDEYNLFIKENKEYNVNKYPEKNIEENKDNKNNTNIIISTKEQSSLNNNKKQDSTSIIIQSYTINNNSSFKDKSKSIVNNKNETKQIFDLSYEYKELLDLYKKSSMYKIIEFIKIIGNHKIAEYIKNIGNGLYISGGANKILSIYDKSFKIVLEITLYKLPNNIVINIVTKSNIKIIVNCRKEFLVISIDIRKYTYIMKRYEIDDVCICIFQLEKSNFILLNEKSICLYYDFFKENKEYIEYEKLFDNHYYKGGIQLNNDIICFTSNSIVPKGKDELVLYDINTKKILEKIEGYSFNLSQNSLCLISNNESNKNSNILLCACKKFEPGQKNGILLVNNYSNESKEQFYHYFYDTNNFEVYCFCPILNIKNENIINEDITVKENIKIDKTDYFIVGGFDEDKREGIIKLFKIENNSNINEINIIYIQDINIEKNNNFEIFQMPITCITQSNISGNIIITCFDGNVYLFKPPNIDFFINLDKKNKVHN